MGWAKVSRLPANSGSSGKVALSHVARVALSHPVMLCWTASCPRDRQAPDHTRPPSWDPGDFPGAVSAQDCFLILSNEGKPQAPADSPESCSLLGWDEPQGS